MAHWTERALFMLCCECVSKTMTIVRNFLCAFSMTYFQWVFIFIGCNVGRIPSSVDAYRIKNIYVLKTSFREGLITSTSCAGNFCFFLPLIRTLGVHFHFSPYSLSELLPARWFFFHFEFNSIHFCKHACYRCCRWSRYVTIKKNKDRISSRRQARSEVC